MMIRTFFKIGVGLVGAVCVAVGPVFAESEHGHGDLSVLGWPAVNFAIFVALMVYLYRRSVSPLISGRAKEVAQHIQVASQKLETARHAHADLSDRLESIAVEKNAIRNRLENDGQKMAEDIVRNAERLAQGVRQDMVRRVESEFRQATNDVRSEMVKLATRRARERLQSELNAEQDARLRNDAVDNLQIR